MKKTKILLISMTALLLAACGTKKAVIQQKPVQDTKVTQPTAPAPKDNKLQSVVAMQRITDNALYQKNLVSNLTFTLNDGRKDITVPGILRMRKDEVIRNLLWGSSTIKRRCHFYKDPNTILIAHLKIVCLIAIRSIKTYPIDIHTKACLVSLCQSYVCQT